MYGYRLKVTSIVLRAPIITAGKSRPFLRLIIAANHRTETARMMDA